ncbi:hypothetical protein [Phytoactinopolyspora mesophila]|uniref:Uncharacterized protein n=1 Tax=Phytoactinopolyspora mesophila TaxID=2650750 RepID=A0A7K3M3K5_9ACTN|nr:hypothetical protein [Phytoactinopolyspora mesophila]NDL57825.1 hypothetical protein [Phytoactinopolyspora mesophila]
MSGDASWRDQRREALASQAAALERRQAAETAQARALISDFVQQMNGLGIPPHPLRARVPDTKASYRTNVTGWYLRRNRSLAVSAAGAFYILDVPASVTARILGVRLEPTDPPLVVGRGARDGESVPLEKLLRLRLEAAHQW